GGAGPRPGPPAALAAPPQSCAHRPHRVRAERADGDLGQIQRELLTSAYGSWHTSPGFQDGAHVAGFEAAKTGGTLDRGDDRVTAPDRQQLDDFGELVFQPQGAGRGRIAQEHLGYWSEAHERNLGGRPWTNATRWSPMRIHQVAARHL